jgi:hypothetical protein
MLRCAALAPHLPRPLLPLTPTTASWSCVGPLADDGWDWGHHRPGGLLPLPGEHTAAAVAVAGIGWAPLKVNSDVCGTGQRSLWQYQPWQLVVVRTGRGRPTAF